MKVRAVGWIASHMQRKLITIVLALCISVSGFSINRSRALHPWSAMTRQLIMLNPSKSSYLSVLFPWRKNLKSKTTIIKVK